MSTYVSSFYPDVFIWLFGNIRKPELTLSHANGDLLFGFICI